MYFRTLSDVAYLYLLLVSLFSIISGASRCLIKASNEQRIFLCDQNSVICQGNYSHHQISTFLLSEREVRFYPHCSQKCKKFCQNTGPWSTWSSGDSNFSSSIRTRKCKSLPGLTISEFQRMDLPQHRTFRDTRSTKRKMLPKAIDKLIHDSLQKEYLNFVREQGETIRLNCDNHATRTILRKYPRAAFRFIHNGKPMKIETDRMLFRQGILSIQSVESTDQGVYLCEIEYEPRSVKTVSLYSVLVTPSDIEIRVKETLPLKIQCHSSSIAHLFEGSVRIWREKQGLQRSAEINASIAKSDIFENTNKSFAGQWTCYVVDKTTNRRWQTASYKVLVDPPPTIFENMFEEVRTNIFKYSLIACSLLAFLFVMCSSFLYKTDKHKSSEQSHIELLKKQLKRLEEVEDVTPSISNISNNDISLDNQHSFLGDSASDIKDISFDSVDENTSLLDDRTNVSLNDSDVYFKRSK